jgi:CBS domain-containing protein
MSSSRSKTNIEDTVSSVMSKNVVSLAPSKKVIDALKVMNEKDIGSVLVVQSGDLVGIITERDVVRNLPKSEKAFFDFISKPLSEAAKKNMISVSPDLEIWEAFEKMLEKKIRRLPVVKSGKLVGIVTERDLFKWVVKVAYEPNLPENIKKLL